MDGEGRYGLPREPSVSSGEDRGAGEAAQHADLCHATPQRLFTLMKLTSVFVE